MHVSWLSMHRPLTDLEIFPFGETSIEKSGPRLGDVHDQFVTSANYAPVSSDWTVLGHHDKLERR